MLIDCAFIIKIILICVPNFLGILAIRVTLTKDLYQNHHVIKGVRILSLDKLSSKKIYSILISNTVNKPTSNLYFEKLFENATLAWSKIYLSPRLATTDIPF